MKSKTTLILLVVVVALGLWIKFYESKQPNTEERKRLVAQVVSFEEKDLDGIVIQNGDDRIELRKSDGKWRLEAPIKDQADSSLVDSLVGTLQSWQKDETISEDEIEKDEGRLEEYDLEKPKLRVKLSGKRCRPRSVRQGRRARREDVCAARQLEGFVPRLAAGQNQRHQKSGRVPRSEADRHEQHAGQPRGAENVCG
jgi:hypothetical protein